MKLFFQINGERSITKRDGELRFIFFNVKHCLLVYCALEDGLVMDGLVMDGLVLDGLVVFRIFILPTKG